MMKDHLVIFDTTLRDGEQSPGASMTKEEKLRVAMAYRQSGNTLCTGTAPLLEADGPAIAGGIELRAPEEPWRTNRILRP